MEINGAVALVTGGCGGLGRAIADHLKISGARVVVADMNAEALHALPETFSTQCVDVTQPDSVKDAVAAIVEREKRIDILVNCAGRIESAPFVNIMNPAALMLDYQRFREGLAINLDSVFLMTSAIVEHMVLRRIKGCIVNISSISARGNEGQTTYSAAKAAVNGLTVTWAKELGRLGIRVNAVAPGFIGTPSTHAALSEAQIKHIISNTPLRRLGLPEEVGKAVTSLVDNDFLNGVVLDVNGGLSI